MLKCTFCGKEKPEHTGLNLIRNDGIVAFYCSRKCKMCSTKLKRDKRKVRWTEAFHITRAKARDRAAGDAERIKTQKAIKKEMKEAKRKSKK